MCETWLKTVVIPQFLAAEMTKVLDTHLGDVVWWHFVKVESFLPREMFESEVDLFI